MITELEHYEFICVRDEKNEQPYYQISDPDGYPIVKFNWQVDEDPSDYLQFTFPKLLSILANGGVNLPETFNLQSFKKFIDKNYPVLSPEVKLDFLLNYIRKRTTFDGQTRIANEPLGEDLLKMYFVSGEEWWFYLQSAVKLGLLQEVWNGAEVDERYDGTKVYEYGLTIQGLARLINANEGTDSKFCFVAMSFDSKLNYIYEEAIAPAIRETGFLPLRVDEVHVQPHVTINDEIIASIKRSYFIIADFTGHKNGVYFEAGYALGRGQKVIYSCLDKHLKKSHFDIRNYQHVVWKDTADFKKKLVAKIEAMIKV